MVSQTCSSLVLVILFIYAVSISSSFLAKAHEEENGDEEEMTRSVGRRILLGFKETPKGSNVTFQCSPSGPCVSCVSSEKREDKYRCSETGYRIPFKCKEVRGEEAQNGQTNNVDDDEEAVASEKPRNLLDDSPAVKVKKSQSYKTYRSCVPSANEEKVSVLGFEAFMFGLLLLSGSAIYFRKKQTVPMLGVSNGRSQSNSRF
uniref:Structural polyprotein n=1 Tax=Noccaea caerulescens TaxID=107243 RepID=A0A1J3K5N6_NOCCA